MDDLSSSLAGILAGYKIAYFSMEVGLMSEIPTYAGGLGVLAGDTLRSSADLGLPLVGVTLVSRRGNFRQDFGAGGRQLEQPQDWDPSRFMKLLDSSAKVQIQGRVVTVKAWLFKLKSLSGNVIPVLLLDTDLEENLAEDRNITHYLYGGDGAYRLKQEIVLGIAGTRILQALGLKIKKYHMNEGHSSLLTLELLRRFEEEEVKELCVFTTHTPVEAGHDKFSYALVEDLIRDSSDLEALKKFGGKEKLNMTLLALNLSNYINGVAKRHGDISMAMFPGHEIHSITNGVHSHTWTCPCFRALYDRYIPGWANEPEKLVRVGGIPDEEIWEAHQSAKRDLLDLVKSETGISMDYQALTIGFARRATEYKRTTLIFSDLDRLRKAISRGRIQMIFAGKAHPKDLGGKKVIEDVFRYARELNGEVQVAYLKNYNMALASKIVSGVDVWLNTPLPPYEASGTSGMKAAHNGVVNFSVLDGWWIEGWIEGVTGWSIGPEPGEILSPVEARKRELDDLYAKLEYIITPTFYDRRDDWISMMNRSIGMIAYYFNTHRMMRRYVTEAYL